MINQTNLPVLTLADLERDDAPERGVIGDDILTEFKRLMLEKSVGAKSIAHFVNARAAHKKGPAPPKNFLWLVKGWMSQNTKSANRSALVYLMNSLQDYNQRAALRYQG